MKRDAAYHEAGHGIVARLSRFHEIVGGIELADYGAGEGFISLSKRKLKAAGKQEDESTAKDKDVARDLALILTAGYIAEKVAAEQNKTLTPSLECAKPDHDMLRDVLSGAGLSKKFDHFESSVEEILRIRWDAVEALADFLFECGSVEYDTLDEKLCELIPNL